MRLSLLVLSVACCCWVPKGSRSLASAIGGGGGGADSVAATTGWGNLSHWVDSTRPDEFHTNTGLIANATYLSYTSTTGSSYFKPGDVNATIAPGWIRDKNLSVDPAAGGMRALTFYETSTRRAIVVFRGTDLGTNNTGAMADQCADSMLWEGVTYADLPAACRAQFTPSQLDYLTHAEAFADVVAQALVGYDVLFTGHSLGAGLAFLVAALKANDSGNITDTAQHQHHHQDAASSELLVASSSIDSGGVGAVVFSTPPMAATLTNRSTHHALNVSSLRSDRYIDFGDANDPLVFEVNASVAGIPGQLCLWGGQAPRPLACGDCFRHTVGGHVDLTRPTCELCFAEHHVFSNYYHNLVGGGTLPSCVAGLKKMKTVTTTMP